MANARGHNFQLLASLVLLIVSMSVNGFMECEDLQPELCAFAVSSSGVRCVLERTVLADGAIDYECQTSAVATDMKFASLLETDACLRDCGLERMSVGIASDALIEKESAKKICSSGCQTDCPNIFDLYTKLAAGEGANLRELCQSQAQAENRRAMGELVFASVSANTVDAWKLLVAQPPM